MATSSEPRTSGKEGSAPAAAASNFIREIIEADRAAGKHGGRVVTRFPPEPNGYLHIGHAKAICLNFGLALDFGGTCHLRLDDTNPTTEDMEYVEAIERYVKWLGFDWKDKLFYASDYYEKLYDFAVQLIQAGKAYVCSLSEEDIRKYRGTAFEPGTPSPYRDRSVEENLDLFRRMRAGEFPDGAHVLRGKIDMASPNLKMRDWPFYRIRHEHHYRTGDAWCIYPLYDFAHCLSDYIEGITHSICTLEFENNRELYDWILDAVGADPVNRPRQYEFARLNLTYTMMSKRKLLELVERKIVSGWDDPRMPTLAGLRRRGVAPEAIRELCDRVGVAKNNSVVDVALLEHVLREDLDRRAPRVLAVLRPLRVVIEGAPEGEVEALDAPYWPAEMGREGSRKLPFSQTIYIDRDDFSEDPPKDWYRLAPGREVRLRHAHVIRCDRVVKDEKSGEIEELRCSLVKDTAGRKIKGTIQWVSAAHAADVEVRLYERLFDVEAPGGDLDAELNPGSLTVVRAKVEPSLAGAKAGEWYQFERLGFFYVDPVDAKDGAPIFNRTVGLKDTWAKIAKGGEKAPEKAPKAEPPPRPKAAEKAPKAEVELSPEAIRLRDAHGIGADEARILAGDPALASLFAEAAAAHGNAKAIASFVINEAQRALKEAGSLPFGGKEIAGLVALVDAGTISSKQAKDVFEEMRRGGGSPRAIVEKKGLSQITDAGALEPAVDAVLAENQDAVGRYRAGNAAVLGALVGMVMKRTGGKANPKLLNELLRKKLAG